MKKQIKLSLLVFLVAALIPVFLYLTAFRINHEKNGFNRKFLTPPVMEHLSPSLNGVYRIGGFNASGIYLGLLYPGAIVKFDSSLRIVKMIRPGYPFIRTPHVSYQLSIDTAGAFLMIGNNRKVYQLSKELNKVVDSFKIPFTFLRSTRINNNTFAFKCFDTAKGNPLFLAVYCKQYGGTGLPSFRRQTNAKSEGLAEDGLISYSNDIHALVFCQFYNGLYKVIDSSLSKMNIYHTIDTIHVNNTVMGTTEKDHKTRLSFSSPQYTVNDASTTSEGMLFVESILKADNQSDASFKDSCTIDAYNLLDKTYRYSFTIPKGSGIADFRINRINRTQILVCYSDHLALFNMPDVSSL
jgi:hypothetical protein